MVSSSRAAAVVGFLVAAAAASFELCLSHDSNDAAKELPPYGYAPGSPTGPESWGKLSPEYRLCSEGTKQSPVDIVTKQAVSNPKLDSLTRTYAATNATLVSNGHDIAMVFDGKVGTITVNGKVYGLSKMHWHLPSEHTINGQRYPLELHLVHRSDDGNVAVIAILYQTGAPDSFYFQLKNVLGEMGKEKCNFAEEDAHHATGLVHMRSLQKRTGSYFRYSGSLTTPPCKENVVWNILGKVRQISKEQLDLLVSLLPGGAGRARPTQPLAGRTVQFYNPPNSTISFQM